jgi:transposase-like protein
LRLKERQPLRVVVEAMAERGHTVSHQTVVNIVKRQGAALEKETA